MKEYNIGNINTVREILEANLLGKLYNTPELLSMLKRDTVYGLGIFGDDKGGTWSCYICRDRLIWNKDMVAECPACKRIIILG